MTAVADNLLPGSLGGFLVALTIGVAMLYGRERLRRLGRGWLVAVIAVHYALSTPLGANLYSAPLARHDSHVVTVADARGATAIVLLTPSAPTYRARGLELREIADAGALRILEAARLYHLLPDPLVIVQGGFPELTDRPSIGSIGREKLIALGVPANRIVIEGQSRNTREHAERLPPLLDRHGIRSFVLVTSVSHMWRASAVFRRAGFEFVPSTAAASSEINGRGSRFKPSISNLRKVLASSHEYAGLLQYRLRGWI